MHRETRNGQPVVTFDVTDVRYAGLLPYLFREGQGVTVSGAMQSGGRFRATEVLVKHDENYMPKDVADALESRVVGTGRRPQRGTKWSLNARAADPIVPSCGTRV